MKNLTQKKCKIGYIYMASFSIVTLVSILFLWGLDSLLSFESINHKLYISGFAALCLLSATAVVLVAKILINTHINQNNEHESKYDNDCKW